MVRRLAQRAGRRLALKAVKDAADTYELTVAKRNHGPKGQAIKLRFHEGALLPLDAMPDDGKRPALRRRAWSTRRSARETRRRAVTLQRDPLEGRRQTTRERALLTGSPLKDEPDATRPPWTVSATSRYRKMQAADDPPTTIKLLRCTGRRNDDGGAGFAGTTRRHRVEQHQRQHPTASNREKKLRLPAQTPSETRRIRQGKPPDTPRTPWPAVPRAAFPLHSVDSFFSTGPSEPDRERAKMTSCRSLPGSFSSTQEAAFVAALFEAWVDPQHAAAAASRDADADNEAEAERVLVVDRPASPASAPLLRLGHRALRGCVCKWSSVPFSLHLCDLSLPVRREH